MGVYRTLAALVLIFLVPLGAAAAPAGKVVIAQGVDPTTLDMMNQSETPASNLGRHIFDTLYERDQSLKVVPALATEMPKLVGPTTWEVKLRKGVKFHNGEDFDAESAKWSLERLAGGQGKLRGATFFAPIERVEIVDPYTVRVHTKTRVPLFPVGMTRGRGGSPPPTAYKDKDTTFISRTPIGTGPYKFVRWAKDEEIVLEANETYWRGAPRIKPVVFKPIPDDAVRVAALQNGEIDVAVNIPPHLAPVIDKHPKLFLSTAPSIRTIQLMFYAHQMDAQHKPVGPYSGPTADKRVRQAIAYAIDADEIIRTVLDGKGIRVATMLPSMHFGYDPSLRPIKQDVERAKKRLAQYHRINKLWIEETPAVPRRRRSWTTASASSSTTGSTSSGSRRRPRCRSTSSSIYTESASGSTGRPGATRSSRRSPCRSRRRNSVAAPRCVIRNIGGAGRP